MTALRVARQLLRIHLPITAGFWIVALVIDAAVVTMLVNLDAVPLSGWGVIATATRWGLFGLGVAVPTSQLRPFIAAGVTRRDFFLGTAILGAALVLVGAVAAGIAVGVESAVYDAYGMLDGRSGFYPLAGEASVPAVFGQLLLTYAAHLIAGLLFGAALYRYGPRIGILLLIPAALPAVVGSTLVGEGPSLPWVSRTVLVPATLAAVVLGLLALYRLLRDIPIRRVTT